MKKNQKYVDKIYKLTRDAAPLSFMLPTRHTRRYPLLWFDEETGNQRALRYARNQKSIFEDEQDGNAIVEPIIFEDGFLRVPKTNQVLQKFLALHPQNGHRFVEVNLEKDAAQELDNMNVEIDALIEAKNLEIEQLEHIVRAVFGQDPDTLTTKEMKRDVLVFARRNPDQFLKLLNDPMLKLQSKVEMFISKGLIKWRNNKKEVWFNLPKNKTKILTVPFGEDPTFITASYFQSDDGIESLKLLEKLLDD